MGRSTQSEDQPSPHRSEQQLSPVRMHVELFADPRDFEPVLPASSHAASQRDTKEHSPKNQYAQRLSSARMAYPDASGRVPNQTGTDRVLRHPRAPPIVLKEDFSGRTGAHRPEHEM